MVNFYRSLVKFNDIAKAFRMAQQEVKKEFPHPYYWGAFILLGE
jgi:CHAT domain-containing protein